MPSAPTIWILGSGYKANFSCNEIHTTCELTCEALAKCSRFQSPPCRRPILQKLTSWSACAASLSCSHYGGVPKTYSSLDYRALWPCTTPQSTLVSLDRSRQASTSSHTSIVLRPGTRDKPSNPIDRNCILSSLTIVSASRRPVRSVMPPDDLQHRDRS